MITGVNLVEWQLRVAAGEPLPWKQERLKINGHAIEARLYAEDPTTGFLPSIGTLERFRLPERVESYEYVSVNHTRETFTYDASLRIDTGYEEGDEVSPFYDPMIAKIIAHGSDRVNAGIGLARAVGQISCWPVKTNASMLHALLVDPDFVRARLSTSFINDHPDVVYEDEGPGEAARSHAAELLVSADIYPELIGFRVNADSNFDVLLDVDGRPATGELNIERHAAHHIYFSAEKIGNAVYSSSLGRTHRITARESRGGGLAATSSGAILAPMPGRIIAVEVSEGQAVTKGQKLVTLEAMKMEHSLTAPFDGTVSELKVTQGDQVQLEALLVRIEPAPQT
jgi:3-methylcrotonyl-CoA carboxylase alpha subunit